MRALLRTLRGFFFLLAMFSSGEHRAERCAAEQVHVQVIHHLPAVLVAVDDEPEAVFGDAFGFRESRATMNMWPSVRSSSSLTSLTVGNRLVGNDQHVHRRLRADVAERGDAVVLVDDGGRNLAGDDLLESMVAVSVFVYFHFVGRQGIRGRAETRRFVLHLHGARDPVRLVDGIERDALRAVTYTIWLGGGGGTWMQAPK